MADLLQIEALIAVHRAAWAALDTACNVLDTAAPGTLEQNAAEDAQLKASDATFQAIWNIVEHPYSSMEELKRGIGYLAEHNRTTGDGDPSEWFRGLAENLVGGVDG